ncbi:MAG: hypothetical protein AB4080_19680 [Trichodesmium sp.]
MELSETVNLSNNLNNEENLRFDEALGAITLIVVITDGYLTNTEINLLSTLLGKIKLFSNYPSHIIERMFDKVLTIFNQYGIEMILKMAMKGIPCYLYNTPFCLTADLFLADSQISGRKEQLFINLCNYLEIPEETKADLFQLMVKQ